MLVEDDVALARSIGAEGVHVTTGGAKAVRAAAAALATAGVRVLGAATVAQTPKRRRW